MASSGASVDVGAMLTAANELDATQAHINSALRTLNGEVDGMSWSGGSASVFHQAFAQFLDDCNRILADLNMLTEEVRTSAKSYAQTHNTTVDVAKHMAGNMPTQHAGLKNF